MIIEGEAVKLAREGAVRRGCRTSSGLVPSPHHCLDGPNAEAEAWAGMAPDRMMKSRA